MIKPYHKRAELVNLRIAEDTPEIEDLDQNISLIDSEPTLFEFEEIRESSTLSDRLNKQQIQQLHGMLINFSNTFSKKPGLFAPFTTTGINFAGSVNIRRLKSRDTAYIGLFTCTTTRALHIELLSDLTTDKFLLAHQRFVGCKELPHTIFTGNATTFHATNKELVLIWQALSSAKIQQYYAQNDIT
ncbi:integrase catalytic domain-containing protein [Nephila pilipes]|uniref:Integrase catalytic domain-containing protein n=1 Tax=Nephila pilipes TaxID=299642 RepID=A0A8X6N5Q1_NEPPI|nr:integrase catalytic domain-containing protein [Nephila pilipes]